MWLKPSGFFQTDGELSLDKLLASDLRRDRKDCSIILRTAPTSVEFRDDSFCPEQAQYGSSERHQLRLGITHS